MKNLLLCITGLLLSFNCLSQKEEQKSIKKEFMYFVYSDSNRVATLPPNQQQLHIEKIGAYIKNLAETEKLKSAQPLETEGVIIGNKDGIFSENKLDENTKVIVGYYHILAKDIKEAIAIAKADPRFEEDGWEIVIRPIKTVKGIN